MDHSRKNYGQSRGVSVVDPALCRSRRICFLPHDTNWSKIDGGTVFDVPNCELGHNEAFLPQKRDGKIARSLRGRQFTVW